MKSEYKTNGIQLKSRLTHLIFRAWNCCKRIASCCCCWDERAAFCCWARTCAYCCLQKRSRESLVLVHLLFYLRWCCKSCGHSLGLMPTDYLTYMLVTWEKTQSGSLREYQNTRIQQPGTQGQNQTSFHLLLPELIVSVQHFVSRACSPTFPSLQNTDYTYFNLALKTAHLYESVSSLVPEGTP